MNITIKNFKHLASLSEETLCFTATVCFNGKAVGSAENHGHGGSTFIHIKDKKVADLLPSSEWERTVDELTFAELRKKEDAKLTKSIKKQLERDILFTRKGKEFEGRYFVFKKGNTSPELAKTCRAKIALMPEADLILNDQPIEVALKYLVKDA
jgi:hypothetical protein